MMQWKKWNICNYPFCWLARHTALNVCVNKDTFRRRMTTSTACFDCLAYSSNRIVLPGQLPGDLNVLQHIWMDPPATFSIHVGPSPVNVITRQTVRVEQLSILSIIEANKVVLLWSQLPSCHLPNDNIMMLWVDYMCSTAAFYVSCLISAAVKDLRY